MRNFALHVFSVDPMLIDAKLVGASGQPKTVCASLSHSRAHVTLPSAALPSNIEVLGSRCQGRRGEREIESLLCSQIAEESRF